MRSLPRVLTATVDVDVVVVLVNQTAMPTR